MFNIFCISSTEVRNLNTSNYSLKVFIPQSLKQNQNFLSVKLEKEFYHLKIVYITVSFFKLKATEFFRYFQTITNISSVSDVTLQLNWNTDITCKYLILKRYQGDNNCYQIHSLTRCLYLIKELTTGF